MIVSTTSLGCYSVILFGIWLLFLEYVKCGLVLNWFIFCTWSSINALHVQCWNKNITGSTEEGLKHFIHIQTLLSIKQLQGCTVKYKKTQINDASTYIMSIFANKSAYYVGLVLVSSSQRNENFYFQFKFTNILSRVCFIAFFSKLTIDTVLSLKRFIRQLLWSRRGKTLSISGFSNHFTIQVSSFYL